MKRYLRTDKPLARSDAFFGATEEELRVLALIADAVEPISSEEVAECLRMDSLGDAKDAIAFWRGAGLIKTAVKRKETADVVPSAETAQPMVKRAPVRSADSLPVYSGQKLSSLIEQGNLASFIEACREIYGKELSSADINILVGLKEELHFDCEYICLLLAHYGERAKKPMRYVEKVAFSLYDEGILTFAQLEAHIVKKQRMQTREGVLRRLFGIGERALSAKEEEAFMRWCEEYNYDDAVIGLAYDLTVGATNKASVTYADKIISRWNTEGCKTLSDVHALIEREKTAKPQKTAASGPKSAKQAEKDDMRSFEVDDFFSHALDRSYGKKD